MADKKDKKKPAPFFGGFTNKDREKALRDLGLEPDVEKPKKKKKKDS